VNAIVIDDTDTDTDTDNDNAADPQGNEDNTTLHINDNEGNEIEVGDVFVER